MYKILTKILFELFYFRKLCKIRIYCNLSYRVNNYIINKDLSVNIISNSGFIKQDFSKIPFKINEFHGNIYCSDDMKEFKNFPKILHGSINCSKNWNINSLIGTPQIIYGDLVANNCSLTSLIGSPLEIHGNLYLDNNYISSLKNGPKIIKGDMYIQYNELSSLNGLNTNIGGELLFLNNRSLPRIINNFPSFSQVVLREYENYSIWNSDNTFNEKRFMILYYDIKNGMYDDIIFKH